MATTIKVKRPPLPTFGQLEDGDWFIYGGDLFQKCRMPHQGRAHTKAGLNVHTGEARTFHKEWPVEHVKEVRIRVQSNFPDIHSWEAMTGGSEAAPKETPS